jgi:hypothetical protein
MRWASVDVPGVLTGADKALQISGTARAPSNGSPLSFREPLKSVAGVDSHAKYDA